MEWSAGGIQHTGANSTCVVLVWYGIVCHAILHQLTILSTRNKMTKPLGPPDYAMPASLVIAEGGYLALSVPTIASTVPMYQPLYHCTNQPHQLLTQGKDTRCIGASCEMERCNQSTLAICQSHSHYMRTYSTENGFTLQWNSIALRFRCKVTKNWIEGKLTRCE